MSVELPKDAEGREIPLDTTVLYDKNDKEVVVSRYQYYPRVGYGYWNIKSVRNEYYRVDEVYLTPPDTLEKLLDDLDNAAKGGDVDTVHTASVTIDNAEGLFEQYAWLDGEEDA